MFIEYWHNFHLDVVNRKEFVNANAYLLAVGINEAQAIHIEKYWNWHFVSTWNVRLTHMLILLPAATTKHQQYFHSLSSLVNSVYINSSLPSVATCQYLIFQSVFVVVNVYRFIHSDK